MHPAISLLGTYWANVLSYVQNYIHTHGSVSCSVVSNSLWPHGVSMELNSPGRNTGVGCHSFFQGIFPTQGLNLGLLNIRQILYHLSHQGRFCQNLQNPMLLCPLCAPGPSLRSFWEWAKDQQSHPLNLLFPTLPSPWSLVNTCAPGLHFLLTW